MDLIEGIRSFLAMRRFMKTPLAQALKQHTEDYFYGNTVLSGFTEELKHKQIEGMTRQMAAALQAPNAALAIREGLVGYSFQYAQLQVLCLLKDEKQETFYSGNPYISGELHHQIDAAAEHVEELAQYKWESGAIGQHLIDFCNGRCAIYLYYMNAFDIARIELGDKTDPDWFRPLVEADLVWVENSIRSKMGLPPTVTDMIEALAYSSMSNMVENGAANPFYEWCKAWPDKYLAGRGPMPIEAS
jgi:hypothetical protein